MSSIKFSNSLVVRLILFALCFVVFGGFVRCYSLISIIREDLLKVVFAQQEALARDMARDVDYKLVERHKMLAKLASIIPLDLLQQPQRLSAWLAERHDLHPIFTQGLLVATPDGMALVDYPQLKGRIGTNYADRDYFQGALDGKFTVGRAIMGRVSNHPILPMAAPIKDSSGSVRAILIGISSLSEPGFLDSIQQGHIGNTGGYLLISRKDQFFIAATKPDLTLKPTAPPGVNLLHDRALAGFNGSGITVNAQGVEEIAAVASVPSIDWFVVAFLPTEESLTLLANMKGQVLRFTTMAMAIVAALLFAGLTIYFRPLRLAAEEANRMTSGELPMQPLPVRRPDEIGYLTTAFNSLMEKLLDTQVELSRMARRDVLTKLPNRIELSERMRQVLARAKRNDKRFAILFLDLDGFKPINDLLGHDVGDEALIEVARRLSACVREIDTLARVGGDEFVIIVGDLDSDRIQAQSAACAIAGKSIVAIQQPMMLKGEARQIGLSIGIALGDGQSSLEALLTAADKAMYAAKNSGRGRYVLADDINVIELQTDLSIQLKDDLLVGVAEIDEQHGQLASMVNDLNKAISEAFDGASLGKEFSDLHAYTKSHFAAEHELMQRYAYPGQRSHDIAHGLLLAQLVHLRTSLKKGEDPFVLQSLKNWLIDHILAEDKPLGDFLQRQINR